jgi:methyl-accepting chemotaxis protein
MPERWTIGQKIAAGFAAVVALAVLTAGVGVYGLRRVVAEQEHLLSVHAQSFHDAEELDSVFERKIAEARGFFFTRDDHFLDLVREARTHYFAVLERLKKQELTEEGRRRLAEIEKAEAEHQEGLDRAFALLKSKVNPETVAGIMRQDLAPRREQIYQRISEFVRMEGRLLEEAKVEAASHSASAQALVMAGALAAVALAIAIALVLGRAISRQVGTAIQHVQGTSTELRTAATQQASGAKQQSGAMTEVATTINELLATSRQIADSAKRVAAIAEKTAASGRSGESAMRSALDSVTGIKRQTDAVVAHMLDLGKRSQQIGGVLEIINELAEQTNILAINATIEAAGATEAGRRFAAVADEIRKLADRVSGSTKEIRVLVDEIRAAVNTTVMATEGGSKAVDAGMREFKQVAASFNEIVSLVGTTTDAAREIELSTRQQSSGVEQVNAAINDVAQSTRESEASSVQMLQTASQLSGLATDLMRLVQPPASA